MEMNVFNGFRTLSANIATEMPDADKPEILRAYLRRWKVEVGIFFDGYVPPGRRVPGLSPLDLE